MDYICLIVCLSWLTGCLLRLYRGTAERDNNAVLLYNNYDIVTTFEANTRTCFYLCRVDYYDSEWLFVVQVHDSLFQQVSLELSYLIDLLILAVLAGLLRHLRQLIYFRICWWVNWIHLLSTADVSGLDKRYICLQGKLESPGTCGKGITHGVGGGREQQWWGWVPKNMWRGLEERRSKADGSTVDVCVCYCLPTC